MGLVTVFCPLITTGAGRFVVHTGEARFVADCSVKPLKLAGHVRMMFVAERVNVSCGWPIDSETLNSMLLVAPFAPYWVPYHVLSDTNRSGSTSELKSAPSGSMLWRLIKLVPSVLTAKIV